jgi:hypothetical protein
MKHESIRVDKCFIFAREYSTRLAYRQELLSRIDGHTETSIPVEVKTSQDRQVCHATNTLHLHFIHHFEVKSALAIYADALTSRQIEFPETL